MEDYKRMTAVEAVRLAKERSGMTAEEIASAAGVSTAVMNRYLRRQEGYLPGLDMLPRLCRAMGNDIILEWLKAQMEERAIPLSIVESPFMAMSRAMASLASVSAMLAEERKGCFPRMTEISQELEKVRRACDMLEACAKAGGAFVAERHSAAA